MPWVPIQDSGLDFTFNAGVGPVLMNSIASCEGAESDTSWSITFTGSPRNFRVESVSGYDLLSGDSATFWWYDTVSETTKAFQPNEAPDPFNAWEPEIFEINGAFGEFGFELDPVGSNSIYAFRLEVFEGDPPPGECCPKSGSRLFKGIASKYRAAQHQPVRARRRQKRCLQVDYSGVLDKDETITKVTWECYSPWVTFMQDPCISQDGKRVCVDVTLNYPGIGDVKATVETTSGTVENYEFEITVTDAPMYPSAQYIPSNGPYQLVAEV